MLRRAVLLVAILGLSGCRLAGGAPPTSQALVPPSLEPAPSASALVGDPRCFEPDVALEYAGRSTTAELGVAEAPGDPMSTHPADIYITRDKFDQGIQHGRLVCAIYVEDGDFVEITVHPSDAVTFTPPPPTPTPTPLPSGSIEILTHCGLGHVRIEYEGQVWRFDVDDGESIPPPGWGFNTTVVEIRSGPEGPIVTGPDGSEWQLIPADPDEEPPSGCL